MAGTTYTFRYQGEGFDQLRQEIDSTAASATKMGGAFVDSVGKAGAALDTLPAKVQRAKADALSESLSRLEGALDPAVAKARQMSDALDVIQAANQQGLIGLTRRAELEDQVAAKFGVGGAAAREAAAAQAAAAAAQAQAARDFDALQRAIDPAYAAQARFTDEVARAKAVLDAVGASEATAPACWRP
ncbi:hypothetical protein [Nitrospirillum sp. BR 11163]|uniref:hypothetical protein n=1 Tax=Nitrospirillum sp. BR 11163 TaxID=3104323 RepID=UPI002AFF9B5E|nr:hypothetical protein [Nitrospirillum sp. BR 11163]MEA1674107.1 hypothetical protein [Nitrospirillum sp. BR 11163]